MGKLKQLNRSVADPVAFCEGKFVGKLKQLNRSMAHPYSLLWRQICGKALQQLNRSAAHHPHVCETDNLQTIWQTQQGI
jgi:hypothetical protein